MIPPWLWFGKELESLGGLVVTMIYLLAMLLLLLTSVFSRCYLKGSNILLE